jgi:hypothetical protein
VSSGTEAYFLGGVVSSLRAAESTKMRKMGDDINIVDLKKMILCAHQSLHHSAK